ncbi:hypothetical protein DFJ77DRAFT_93594 [Powellomyces hirtus]|nr:hypothetical protein DFJ77DRAFT_93594 [Powellomyces hirtus]
MLPLKSGLEDETAKPRLRRTISEGQLVEGEIRLQTSMPAGALNSAMSSRRQSPNPYSTGNRNNIYMTPNPSPHRVGSLVSERRGSATSAASLQAQSNMDELVIRTKALLDHQMRTNLAFAEAVAAEYGRELSSRIEAQRRAFSAEQTRRMQIMEMNARRRVADAEDAIRRQYEERQTGASAMSDRQAEFRSNSDARETVNLPAAVHRRLAELHREVMILSTELEVQKVANRQLRHDLARDEERSRAASAESGASGQAMVAGNRSPSLPESIDPRDLKNKSHQELCSIIHYLNEERNRAMRECILLSRKMESLTTHSSEDHMQNAEHGDVGSEAQRKIGSDSHTETWMDLLQIEILHLDKGMMWTSQGIENQSGISERVNAMLSELRNFSAKLENLLRGAPARRSSMDQLKRRATVWEQPKVTAPGELRSPAAMISMFDPFVQARGDTLEPYDTQGLEKRPSPALSPSEPVSHRHWQLDNKMAANAPTPDSHSHEIVQQMYALGLGAESEPARAFKGPEAGKEQHASDRSASTKEASGTAKAASATEESAKDAN